MEIKTYKHKLAVSILLEDCYFYKHKKKFKTNVFLLISILNSKSIYFEENTKI